MKEVQNTARSLSKLLACVILWLWTEVLHAQPGHLHFNHLPEMRELSHNVIFSIIQDKSGYMWFGTYDGLYKYDGYSLVNFSGIQHPGSQIPTVPIRGLAIDKYDRMWIATMGKGLWVMDMKTGKLRNYRHDQLNANSISSDNLTDVFIDIPGSIWMVTEDKGVSRLDPSGKSISTYKINVTDLAKGKCDTKGNIWVVSTSLALYRYDKDKDELVRDSLSRYDNNIYRFLSFKLNAGGESYAIRHSGGVYKLYDKKGKECESAAVPADYINDICTYRPAYEAKNGQIWIGRKDGLFRLDSKTLILTHYRHTYGDAYSLAGSVVYAIYEDEQGNMWIGTDQGINKLNYTQQYFSLYDHQDGNPGSISSDYIRAIYKDGAGTIWLATPDSGLSYIDSNNRAGTVKFRPVDKMSDHIGINVIYEDSRKQMWAGGLQGAAILNRQKHMFDDTVMQLFSKDKQPPRLYSVWAYLELEPGKMLIGAKDGLFWYDEDRQLTKKYTSGVGNALAGNSVWCLSRDAEGNIWAGTNNGITRIIPDGDNFRFINYIPDEKKANALHAHNVWSIYASRKGELWIASSDGGLSCFHPYTNTFTQYTERNGLPSNMVCGLLQDKRGNLWVSTTKGICVFDTAKKYVSRVYNQEDGLQSDNFNFKSCYKDEEGLMYFGGKLGFNVFDPEKIEISHYDPHVIISSFKVEYQEMVNELLADSDITLDYTRNSFSFDFASSDFTDPHKNSFTYKMDGLDDNWISLGSRHYIAINNLLPGRYIFYLKCTNSESIWGSRIFRASITILPPFWQRWWFRALAAVAVLSVLSGGIYIFIRQKDLQQKKTQSELDLLRAQLNPHFIFNSLTSLQTFIITNRNELALDYVERFSDLVRMILENSKQDTVSLAEEIEFLELYVYMESVRLGHTVQFHIETDEKLDTALVRIPPMLVQPLIENALKHGQLGSAGGRIDIRFTAGDTCYTCTVEDNGIGREEAKKNIRKNKHKRKSIGLENIEERLKILNNRYITGRKNMYITDLYNIKGQAAGTRVELIIPYLQYYAESNSDR